jgi:hypothetical protein
MLCGFSLAFFSRPKYLKFISPLLFGLYLFIFYNIHEQICTKVCLRVSIFVVYCCWIFDICAYYETSFVLNIKDKKPSNFFFMRFVISRMRVKPQHDKIHGTLFYSRNINKEQGQFFLLIIALFRIEKEKNW